MPRAVFIGGRRRCGLSDTCRNSTSERCKNRPDPCKWGVYGSFLCSQSSEVANPDFPEVAHPTPETTDPSGADLGHDFFPYLTPSPVAGDQQPAGRWCVGQCLGASGDHLRLHLFRLCNRRVQRRDLRQRPPNCAGNRRDAVLQHVCESLLRYRNSDHRGDRNQQQQRRTCFSWQLLLLRWVNRLQARRRRSKSVAGNWQLQRASGTSHLPLWLQLVP